MNTPNLGRAERTMTHALIDTAGEILQKNYTELGTCGSRHGSEAGGKQHSDRHNDVGPVAYTVPSNLQYPHQWNWDSALTAIGLATFDVPRALREIESLLRAQWNNGMVPHIVFHDTTRAYFPDATFWQTDAHSQPGFASSGITQPPVVATALRRIAEREDITDFIRTWYDSIARWHRWFHTDRAVDESGLAVIVHPWESGMDDSPRWLDVMSRITPDGLVDYKRADLNHVSAAERPTDGDYDRFMYLVDLQRRHNWNTEKALETSPFRVHDVLVNSVLLRADADLIWLGQSAGIDTSAIEKLRDNALQHFSATFWNEQRGLFLDRDLQRCTTIGVNTAATFMPMWAGVATPEQAQRLVDEHLTNTTEYWSHPGEGYVVPTCARNEPAWAPAQYWRGPVWVLMNWFVHEALVQYGYDDLADRVQSDTIDLLSREGFAEYYNCTTGRGCGVQSFSWSAALLLDLLD